MSMHSTGKSGRGPIGALRLLFSDKDADLVSHQLEETRTALPVLAVMHFFATLAVYRLGADAIAPRELLIWTVASFVAEGLLIIGYFAMDHVSASAGRGQNVLRFGPFAALFLCLVWGWAALVFTRAAEPPVPAYIDLLALLTLSVGLLCTVRLPATALQFIFTPIAILLTRASLAEEQFNIYGPIIAGVAALAGLCGMLALSYSLKRRVLTEKTLRHDMDVLMMMLKDFGGQAKDWLWESDADGRLTYHSPRFAEVLGRPGENVVGVDFLKDFVSQNAPLMISKFLIHEDLRDEPLSVREAKGFRHWRLSAKPRFDDKGTFQGYRGIAQDVTTQRMEQQALALAEDEARRAFEAKAQFLALMSHELRTPVNAIVGFSEVLSTEQSESLPPVVRRDYMATILNSGRQLQGLINDVLEATRLERGAIKLDEQQDDFGELVSGVIRQVSLQASRAGVSIVARLYEDVEVTGDVARLRAAALSLVSNAIAAAPQATAVQVEMARDATGNLALTVRDTGTNYTPEEAVRVFEPFSALEAGPGRRGGSNGLGLAIARRVARLHGGEVALQPRKEKGAESVLVLPAWRIRWPGEQLKVMNIAA